MNIVIINTTENNNVNEGMEKSTPSSTSSRDVKQNDCFEKKCRGTLKN